MSKTTVAVQKVLGVLLVAAGVFLAVKAYHPAESGMTQTRAPGRFVLHAEPYSKGASVDPVLGAGAAACLAGAAVLLLKRS